MLAGLIPAVIDGVKSLATNTVFAGTCEISTSSIPIKILSIRDLISIKSVALCWINSSGTVANISAVWSSTCSNAISAEIFSLIINAEICSSIIGSWSIWIWPLSASCSPTVFAILSAISFVIETNFSIASCNLFNSASVSVTLFFSTVKSCSSINTTFPIPIPSEPAIPLYISIPHNLILFTKVLWF